MSRSTYQFREATTKKKTLHAIWRGVGFIILVLLTVGGFWLAGYLLELNWTAPFLPWSIPRTFSIKVADWAPAIPGKLLVQIVATLVLDIFAYAAMVIVYSVLFPFRPGEKDAPQPRGRGRRSLIR